MNKSTGQLISSNGTTLYAVAEGNPTFPPLLLCNGLGTTHAMWAPQMPAFLEDFYVIRYDARGHGQSATPVGEYTIDMLGLDALGVLDHFGIQKANFCGLSMGGAVGQWLGIHAPERLDRLVVSNTAPYFGPPENWINRMKAVSEGGLAGITETLLHRWFTPHFLARHDSGVEQIRAMLLVNSPAGYSAGCAALRDMDLRPLVQTIAVPTLVIGGLDDPATSPRQAHDLAQAIKGAVLALMPAAHMANVECPAEFTSTVLEYLKG